MAVKSILERQNEEEANKDTYINKNLNWGKKNSMAVEKYQPPVPAEYHDSTVNYLGELREKRRNNGVNMQS